MHSRCNLEQSCQGLLPFLVLIVIHDVWPKRGVKLKLFEALHHVGNYWPLLLGVQVHGEMTVRAEKDWVCVCGGGGAKGIWNCFWLNRISCFVANILLPAIGLKKDTSVYLHLWGRTLLEKHHMCFDATMVFYERKNRAHACVFRLCGSNEAGVHRHTNGVMKIHL